MKILAVLQNQWFHDPERVKRLLAQHDNDPKFRHKLRRRLITYSLFAGCKTGQILKKCLGSKLCEKITWEEASPEHGGRASSCFPADRAHLTALIQEEQPDIIIAFGKIARDGLADLFPSDRLLTAPHPTARHAGVLDQIRALRPRLEAAGAIV